MSWIKRSRKPLALSLLAALASMAFMATAAKAGPEYYVEATLLAGVETLSGSGGTFKIIVPGVLGGGGTLVVKCTSETDNAKIQNETANGLFNEGKIAFGGCAGFDELKEEKAICEVAPFEMKTAGRLIFHNNAMEIYNLIVPIGESEVLGTIEIKGAGCGLKEGANVVTGSTVGKYTPGFLAVTQALTFSKPIDELICNGLSLCGLFIAGHRTYLSGVANQAMVGAKIGKKWQVK